jgi:hypothetical protein
VVLESSEAQDAPAEEPEQ